MYKLIPFRQLRAFVPIILVFLSISLATGQELVSSEELRKVSLEELKERYGIFPKYGVIEYKVTYTTTGIDGEPDIASGLIVVPDLADAIFPKLCYQHGTVGTKDDVPSNLKGGYQIAEVFGSLGYFSVAPDYLGLGESAGFHPYLHAESEAWVAMDLLEAAKAFADMEGLFLNEQLFITGYSQGGHAAAALHRAIEEQGGDENVVTASAPMAGPYVVSEVMKTMMLSEELYSFPAYLPNTLLSYDLVYGLFEQPEDVFKTEYADMIELYTNGSISLFDLNSRLIDGLKDDFGASIPKYMLRDSVITNVSGDPDHPFNRALRDNDVHEWAPKAPTRLFHCKGDDQVPYENTVVTAKTMNELGAADVQGVQVDLKEPWNHNECVEPALLLGALFFNAYQKLGTTPVNNIPILPLNVSPNPAKDHIMISGLPGPAQVTLYDLSGKEVLRKTTQNIEEQLWLEGVPPGIYLLQVQAREGRYTGKLVVSP